MSEVDTPAVQPLSAVRYGVRSMVRRLRRVMVRRPALDGDWDGAGWRRPDVVALARQHDAFVQLLVDLGCEVDIAPPCPGMVDAVYTYDPAFVVGTGAVILRSPKPNRTAESDAAAGALSAVGMPIVGRLTGDAFADGGDLFHFEDGALVAGRSYRTNAEALRQLATIAAADNSALLTVDVPHDRGPAYCLHLLSLLSPVHERLAVVYEPLCPVALLDELRQRDIDTIAIDRDDYEAMGTNVLAVRPGVVIMVEGATRTRRALEARGVEVHMFDGSELCHKGDGGPTCLTRPLWRD